MINFTEPEKQQQREQRERIKVGDQVAVLGPRDRVLIQKVTKVTAKCITIGSAVYHTRDGRCIGQDNARYRVRGFPTQEELDALAQRTEDEKHRASERRRRDEEQWSKQQELELLLVPLASFGARLARSENADQWVIENLTESALRFVGNALRNAR